MNEYLAGPSAVSFGTDELSIVKVLNDFSKDKNVYVMFVPDSILVNEDKMHYHLDIEEGKELDNLYNNLKNTTNIDLRNILIEKNKEEQMYYRTDHHWTTFGAYYAYVEFMKTKNEEYLNKEDFEKIKKFTNNIYCIFT